MKRLSLAILAAALVMFSGRARAASYAGCGLLAGLATLNFADENQVTETYLALLSAVDMRAPISPVSIQKIISSDHPISPEEIFPENLSNEFAAAFGKVSAKIMRHEDLLDWGRIRNEMRGRLEKREGDERRSQKVREETRPVLYAIERKEIKEQFPDNGMPRLYSEVHETKGGRHFIVEHRGHGEQALTWLDSGEKLMLDSVSSAWQVFHKPDGRAFAAGLSWDGILIIRDLESPGTDPIKINLNGYSPFNKAYSYVSHPAAELRVAKDAGGDMILTVWHPGGRNPYGPHQNRFNHRLVRWESDHFIFKLNLRTMVAEAAPSWGSEYVSETHQGEPLRFSIQNGDIVAEDPLRDSVHGTYKNAFADLPAYIDRRSTMGLQYFGDEAGRKLILRVRQRVTDRGLDIWDVKAQTHRFYKAGLTQDTLDDSQFIEDGGQLFITGIDHNVQPHGAVILIDVDRGTTKSFSFDNDRPHAPLNKFVMYAGRKHLVHANGHFESGRHSIGSVELVDVESGSTTSVDVKSVNASQLYDVYARRDGRIMAVLKTQAGIKIVQIYGPVEWSGE